MRPKRVLLLVLVLAAVMVASLTAQVRSSDPNIAMMDNCSEADPDYAPFGGCPEGAPFPGYKSYRGDVSVTEFFALLTSPLGVGHVFGHPSWRNEPSYVTAGAGQTVRVTNRGGRAHTFTKVEHFGGGFVPLLNEDLDPAPECGADFMPNPDVVFVGVGQTQTLSLDAGLHKFQCCIHPWMRGAVRVQ
jgi:plastocyanin